MIYQVDYQTRLSACVEHVHAHTKVSTRHSGSARTHYYAKVHNLPYPCLHIFSCTEHDGSLPRAAEISTFLSSQNVTMNVPLPCKFGLLLNKVTQYDDEGKLAHPSVVMKINTKSVFVKYRQVATMVKKKGFDIQLKT